MPSTKSYKILHEQVTARPGAEERLAALRKATLDEIRLREQRRASKQPQTETTSKRLGRGDVPRAGAAGLLVTAVRVIGGWRAMAGYNR